MDKIKDVGTHLFSEIDKKEFLHFAAGEELFSEIESDADLLHFGVLGMKWGVRKDLMFRKGASEKTKASSKQKKTAKEGTGTGKSDLYEKAARKKAKKRRRVLTGQEIESINKKLKLETEMSKLIDEDLRPAKTFMQRIAKDVARQSITTAATTIATGAMIYGTRATLRKKGGGGGFNFAELAEYYKPKK